MSLRRPSNLTSVHKEFAQIRTKQRDDDEEVNIIIDPQDPRIDISISDPPDTQKKKPVKLVKKQVKQHRPPDQEIDIRIDPPVNHADNRPPEGIPFHPNLTEYIVQR
jgi:hypothetical protein